VKEKFLAILSLKDIKIIFIGTAIVLSSFVAGVNTYITLHKDKWCPVFIHASVAATVHSVKVKENNKLWNYKNAQTYRIMKHPYIQ
jgi:hypothetical protein